VKELKQGDAARKLEVSTRQLRRILREYRKDGPSALIHKSRGKVSNNKTPQELLDQAIGLVRDKYDDFGPTFASETLEKRDNLIINHDVLRIEMIRVGLWKMKQRKHKHRQWRERKECFGEMVQFDGSHHLWFELRGKVCCLLASKDDATNQIYGHFTEHENIKGVFKFWKEYIQKYGKPKSIYLDRGSVYKVNHKSVFDDPEVLTQFERVCKELGIEVIHAKSPQAKGRIENGFGTLQDRLVKEMRLRHIDNITDANRYLKEEFLSEYNQRFAVPAKTQGDFHKPLIPTENPDQIFSVQSERQVNNDFTVRLKGKWYQLAEIQSKTVLQKSKVTIEERMDGTIAIQQNNIYLTFKEIDKKDITTLRKEREDKKIYVLTSNPNMARKPSPNHIWRRYGMAKTLCKNRTF
jgi:transposase InsO family protein